jgi:hypothetical protein
MALKYEKPLIIPLSSDGDETGLGLSCAAGTTYAAGNCSPGGNAGNQCRTGSLAGGNCGPGTGPNTP